MTRPTPLGSAGVNARVAVFVSGSGTTLQSLLDHPITGPWIALVVADRSGIKALERARAAGVPTFVVEWAEHPDRGSFGRAIHDVLVAQSIEFVALAGFMRILPSELVRSFQGRILNTHPALLPSFPGAHPVRDTLAWGVKVSGATVHLVDDEVDHGPIVLQEAVEVMDDDDEESLHRRIREVEHRLYSEALRMLVEGRLKVEGRRVHVLDGNGDPR
jgi:phosphoribosylglycinamide formyltransferase-1